MHVIPRTVMDIKLLLRITCFIATWSIGSMMKKEAGHVCEETEKIVSSCPRASELDQLIIKCSEVCGDFEGQYKHHCMRDSLKTNLFALCAIPKRLFDYCPEYDRKGKRIQIDMSTSCKVSRYYISSDISLCDPDRCLQLIEKRVNTTGTNITKEATAYNEGGKHKDWMSQNWYILFPSILVIALLSSILSVKIHKRICNKYSSRESSRSKEDDLHNPLHNDNYTRGELNMQTLQRYEDEEE